MNMDDAREFMFCPYCGTKVVNVPQKVEINQNIYVSGANTQRSGYSDYSNKANLIIDYASTDQTVPMIVALNCIRQKITLISGQEMAFFLPEGEQIVVLKVGWRSYKRKVCIVNGNHPVRIHASWTGVAQIIMDASNTDTYGLIGTRLFNTD